MPANPKSNRSSQFVIWGSVFLVIVLGIYAVRSLTRERVGVRVATVGYQDLQKTSPTNGKVEPIDDFQSHALTAGQIQEIYVNVGEKVKAGQMLLRMDDKYALASLAHAQSTVQAAELAASDIEHGGSQDERNTYASNLERAKLQLQQDTASLGALQQLQKQGAASIGEVSAAQHRVDMDQANLQSIQQHSTQRYGKADRTRAQADLADAKAGMAAAQSSYANAAIHSPINGTVYYLPVSQYDYVTAGEDLVYIADLKHLRITAYFDEPEIGGLAAGQPVKIIWEAKPGTVWHGHITLAPTTVITYGTRNVGECYITVDDADGVLQPNANVTVTVTTALHPHVLSVPRESLHFEGVQPYVFRVIGNKLVRTDVKIDIVNSNWAEITSGLADGDVVARAATTNLDLSDGLPVKVVQ
jgi:HlyD family secretion protein